jgi:RNA polymerase sigma-70 factor (ECF subfamily)
MQPDTEIVQKLIHGDESTFRDFVENFKDKGYSLSLKILKNPDEAEDSLQDSFIKFYRALIHSQFQGKSKLSTYFYTIVYNTALDHYKKKKKMTFSMISIDINDSSFKDGDELTARFKQSDIDRNILPESIDGNTDKVMSAAEIENIIANYIDNIPEQYSVILNMFYINELSHKEICDILKLPIGTVKNRIFRAKEKIKELILKRYSEDEILQYIN